MNKLQIGKMPQLPFEVSEAINQLRINLSFCGSDVKTIMITSSTPNEGKSFVTMQLWRRSSRPSGVTSVCRKLCGTAMLTSLAP